MPLTIAAVAYRAAYFAAFCAAPLLAGCVTDGPKNALGGTVNYNEPVGVTPDKADTNVAVFIDLRRIGKIERRIRDNHMIVERFSLVNSDGHNAGYVSVQRVPNGFFSQSTVSDAESLEGFRERVASILKTPGYASQAAAEKLQNKRARATVGYKTVAQLKPGFGDCFVARAAYRLDMLTMYDNDWAAPDTVVETVYCDRVAANFAQFNELMAGFGLMQLLDASGIQAKMATAPAAAASSAAPVPRAAPSAPAASPSVAPAPRTTATAPAAASPAAPALSAAVIAPPTPSPAPAGPLDDNGRLVDINTARTDCQVEMRNADLAAIRDKIELLPITEVPPPARITSLTTYPNDAERVALKTWMGLYNKCQQRLAPLEMAAQPTGSFKDVHVAQQGFSALFNARASELASVLSDSRMTYAEYAGVRWRMAKDTADACAALNTITLRDPQRRVVDVKNIQDKFQRTMDDWTDKIQSMKARPIQVGANG